MRDPSRERCYSVREKLQGLERNLIFAMIQGCMVRVGLTRDMVDSQNAMVKGMQGSEPSLELDANISHLGQATRRP